MKISSLVLGLGAAASVVTLNLAAANAQVGNGSDAGNIFTSVVNTGTAGVTGTGYRSAYPAASQSAVNQFSQSLSASSIGDQATFDTINGSSPAPLAAALLPTGVAADGATGRAAANLANAVQGMRASNGDIDATKLNAAVPAYNSYVSALVGEVGPDKAVADAPAAQKSLQGLLSQLVQVANQSSPTPTQSAPSTPSTPSMPMTPSTPGTPSTPTAPPTP